MIFAWCKKANENNKKHINWKKYSNYCWKFEGMKKWKNLAWILWMIFFDILKWISGYQDFRYGSQVLHISIDRYIFKILLLVAYFSWKFWFIFKSSFLFHILWNLDGEPNSKVLSLCQNLRNLIICSRLLLALKILAF